jgi:hypothetical protein
VTATTENVYSTILCNYWTSTVLYVHTWRLIPQFVIPLIFGLPESPRWLYQRGRSDEALQVLCDVYDLPPDAPKVIKEQSEILDNIRMQQEAGEYKWSQLFKRDEFQTGRRVLLAYGLMFIQQLSGVNLIV